MNQCDFLVDKRTELISIILALSQGNEYIEEHFSLDLDDQYKKDVNRYFSKFSKEKAVKIAKELAKKEAGFNFDNPIRMAFEINKNFEYVGSFSNYLKQEIEDIDLCKSFLLEVTKLNKISNFDNFYKDHEGYYKSLVSQLEEIFNTEKFLAEIQNFFKTDVKQKFCVNIIPSLLNSNHGFKVKDKYIANIGLNTENFKTIEKFNNGYQHIIIHEFLHPFVNPVTEKLLNNENLKDFSFPINYGNKKSYINETIVRALTIRLREKLSKIDVEKFLKMEELKGFNLIGKIYKEIVKYEKKKITWEEFLSNLIKNYFTQDKSFNK